MFDAYLEESFWEFSNQNAFTLNFSYTFDSQKSTSVEKEKKNVRERI